MRTPFDFWRAEIGLVNTWRPGGSYQHRTTPKPNVGFCVLRHPRVASSFVAPNNPSRELSHDCPRASRTTPVYSFRRLTLHSYATFPYVNDASRSKDVLRGV